MCNINKSYRDYITGSRGWFHLQACYVEQEDIKTIDLIKENFEEKVLRAQGYILADFYDDGCVPCATLTPYIHGFEKVYGEAMKSRPLNTIKARRLTISQKALRLPVIAVHEDGSMIDSRVKENVTSDTCGEMIRAYV